MNTLQDKIRAKIPGADTGIQVKQTICDICCPSFHCGVDAYVKDGVVVKLEGTERHPTNHGLLCPKGLAGRQYLYRKDRIRTPLRRTGERGEGRFEPIAWDEAYDAVAENLISIKEKYGPESVIFFSGYSKWYRPYLHRLAYSFGSLNYATESSQCMTSTFLQWLTVTGNVMSGPDTAGAGVYLGWAFNPYHSRHLAAAGVEKGKARGMKVIIVDPRETPTTRMLADLHLRPRPGADGALALGIGSLLIQRGYIDGDYIKKYVHGFLQYAEYVERFTMERVERLTGVPATQVGQAADLIGQNLPLAINESAAPIAHHTNGLQSYRAIMALSAITGSFDVKGGQIPVHFSYNYMPAGFRTREERFIHDAKPEGAKQAIGSARFPLWSKFIEEAQVNDIPRQAKTGDPYPLKAMLGFGVNYRIAPGDYALEEALLSMDFLVNTDLFLTDTCRLCDIVLPACTSYERGELKAFGGGYLTYTQPVVSPLYESRPDTRIICDLAAHIAPGDKLLTAGPEACALYMIEDLPVTLERLRDEPYPVKVPDVPPYVPGTLREKGLSTQSGKFELWSLAIESLEGSGLKPLPEWEPSLDDADPERYPFILCSAPRLTHALHSRLHEVPWNRSIRPTPMADLHPDDAARLGITQEDPIDLFTERGSIRMLANLTARILPGTVTMYHGYSEADVNSITDPDHLDPYSGFPGVRSLRVGVRRASLERRES
jgi:anaerobic selenocysteine-containing dehydrogenase